MRDADYFDVVVVAIPVVHRILAVERELALPPLVARAELVERVREWVNLVPPPFRCLAIAAQLPTVPLDVHRVLEARTMELFSLEP